MVICNKIWYQHANTRFLPRATWNCRPATPESVHKSQADSRFSLVWNKRVA